MSAKKENFQKSQYLSNFSIQFIWMEFNILLKLVGLFVLLFLIDVFGLSEWLFSRPMSICSGAWDVSRAGCGSKLLIGWTLLWIEEKKHKRMWLNSALLRTVYQTHLCSLCTLVCEKYKYSSYFGSILNLLTVELSDSRGICVVGEPNCVTEKWRPIFCLISQAAWQTAWHLACALQGSHLMRGPQLSHSTLDGR